MVLHTQTNTHYLLITLILRHNLINTGLDEAVLGFGPDLNAAGGDPEQDAKRVAALLEHGAHGLLSAGAQEGVEQASAAFQNADIDTVRVCLVITYAFVCV